MKEFEGVYEYFELKCKAFRGESLYFLLDF